MDLFIKPKNEGVLKPNGKPLAAEGEMQGVEVRAFWKHKEMRGEVTISDKAPKKAKELTV